MGRAAKSIALCPHCDRSVSTCHGRYSNHALVKGGSEYCPMSKQRTPTGGETPADYVARAHLIGDLAAQVRDIDTAVVWTYLQHVPADELRRLLLLTLATVQVDQTIEEVFGWVCDLPVASEAIA